MAFKTYYNLAPCYLYELIYASSHSRCSAMASLASSSSVQCSSTSRPLLLPLLGKIFHSELYCLHLHFLPNLSAPFPIIILFPQYQVLWSSYLKVSLPPSTLYPPSFHACYWCLSLYFCFVLFS